MAALAVVAAVMTLADLTAAALVQADKATLVEAVYHLMLTQVEAAALVAAEVQVLEVAAALAVVVLHGLMV